MSVCLRPKSLFCPAAGANPWPFLHWPDYQQQQWKQLVQAAQQAAREGHKAWKAGGGRILGNDCHTVRAVFIHQGFATGFCVYVVKNPLVLSLCCTPSLL